GPPPIVSWSTPDPMPLPCDGIHVWPSSSEYDVLQVSGDSSVSSPANVRPVCGSVKPIGSESTAWDVGAARLTQVELCAASLKVTNNVCRSDWKLVTPDFQLLPIEGSPAPRPIYSTECTCPPAEVVVTGVSTPGASKFS